MSAPDPSPDPTIPQSPKSRGMSFSAIGKSIRLRSSNFNFSASPKRSNSLKNKIGETTTTEAYFVLILGLLLSLNSGYINGLCLGGMLSEHGQGSRRQAVSAFTGTYTKSGLALATGDYTLFGFEISLIFSFIAGAFIAGAMNPKAIPHKLVPSYGPTFLIGCVCMIAAAICAEVDAEGRSMFYFAAMANGLQNGMTSTYSANLIRTSHLTGTSTDIGLIAGQILRGNWKNYWKFKVLVGLACSFWVGGLVSFYSASAFFAHALWFSAALYLTIGASHLTFVVLTQHVSFVQACVGTWEWDKALNRISSIVVDGSGGAGDGGGGLANLSPDQVDKVFDAIDADGSGSIDASELKEALGKLGMKVTTQNVEAMIRVVDENGDGVVDREEFHTLVRIATARSNHKQQAKMKRKNTVKSLKTTVLKRSLTAPGLEEGDNTNSLIDGKRDAYDQIAEEDMGGMRQRLPHTYQEALPPMSQSGNNGNDIRAIVVTEAKPPFAVVGVNEAWSDLCGYKAEEAISKSMSHLIQGPKTNREGLKDAMARLIGGADQVECTTVNYRKDGSMFTNLLQMGPLYADDDGSDMEEGKREVAYYVGILNNIGELAQDMSGMDEKEEKDDFEENMV